MPVEPTLPSAAAASQSLLQFEPERYWAVWQFPELRHAYMIGPHRDAWLILADSEEAGQLYLLTDAALNGRSPSEYRLDELTLPEAFAVARTQKVPFASSIGTSVQHVLGVEIRTLSQSWWSVHYLPL